MSMILKWANTADGSRSAELIIGKFVSSATAPVHRLRGDRVLGGDRVGTPALVCRSAAR